MKILPPEQSGFNLIFTHSNLDDFHLDPFAFRIFAHLSRRAGKHGEAWSGVSSMMRICEMSRQTVINSIRKLESLNMIQVVRKHGCSNHYWPPPPSQWRKPIKSAAAPTPTPSDEPLSEMDQSISDTPPVYDMDCHQSMTWTRRVSNEGTPLKKNTVDGPPDPIPAHPPPSQEPWSPGGSLPDGKPAVSRQDAGKDSNPAFVKPSQTSIQRKAYAIAARLQRLHWDNCKVRFVKETARAYAEKALRDGHDDRAILTAYDKTLHYCHGVATDEINRGERFPHEKATPALTVWLARERLKGDPRTVEERWKVVIVKLTVEQRKFIEEEARLRQEIYEKTPEIKAWFATRLNRDLPANRVPMHEMEPFSRHKAPPVSPVHLCSRPVLRSFSEGGSCAQTLTLTPKDITHE